MQDDDFEWDDDKAAHNLREHKISFEIACLVFSDAFAIAKEDRREPFDEIRYNLIGMAQCRLLHVTYTQRGERIRIISARRAEPRERRRYHEHNTDQ